MKYKTLLSGVLSFFTLSLAAQQTGKISGYAITGPNKGDRGWKQVRLIDMKSGAELKSVYAPSAEQPDVLNARTGQPIEKKDKDVANATAAKTMTITDQQNQTYTYTITGTNTTTNINPVPAPANGNFVTTSDKFVTTNDKFIATNDKLRIVEGKRIQDPNDPNKTMTRTVVYVTSRASYDQPFATTSAAAAYDKKHQRLYYTPMGIAELRYIDLKAKKSTVYYFQDEKFGVVAGMHDGGNQVTRMVIGSDGDGYALTNNGNHLIKFTTGKKPVFTDLGALTDDAANGRFSVHSTGAHGGDMVAGKSGDLYLVTASRHVFKINVEKMTAAHMGGIKGLPATYQTNGAMVEEGTNIIVASAESAEGYYIFDLNTLQAQKYTTEGTVYNASDLAGSNLVADKKSKKDKEEVIEQPVVPQEETLSKTVPAPVVSGKAISVYPNPVTNGEVKVSFNTLPAGRYMIQLTDMNGQVITTSDVVVGSKNQVETLRLPALITKGSYVVKVQASGGREAYTETIIVQ